MKTIDADAHVIEGEATWDFLEPQHQHYRPVAINLPGRSLLSVPAPNRARYWISDGAVMDTAGDEGLAEGVRDLTDIPARLEKMDEVGIEIQVIYPTLFLVRPTERPEVHLALARAYNRFMADVWSKSKNRLRWVVVTAVDSMAETLAELDFSKAHGACGVLLLGVEGLRVLSNPYFDPLYERAEALDLPICTHVGIGNRPMRVLQSSFLTTRSPVLSAFHDLLLAKVPARFPKLRFGFIEAGAQWIPYVISEVRRRGEWIGKEKVAVWDTLLQDNRLFVSCRIDDDIAYILKWAGKDNLMTGTDLGHDDYSRDILAFRELREKGGDAHAIDGILGRNAGMFYGIST